MVRMVALHAQAERGYGKEFDAHPVLARTLKLIRWADDAPTSPSHAIAAALPVVRADLDELRREYLTAAGEPADKRWGKPRLKDEISRRTYQRRDMIAEE